MNVDRPMDDPVYIVTDIEADGPRPGEHSMIAFASVAVTAGGNVLGEFEAVLSPLSGAAVDPETTAWWRMQPEAWAAANDNPRPAETVMADFVRWVSGFERGRVFTANPASFDGMWIDFYLKRFTRHALLQGPYANGRLFDGPGLCLKSYCSALTGLPTWRCGPRDLPPAWLGEHEHTHRAIDDARGYAHLLGVLMGARPDLFTPPPQAFAAISQA